MDGSSRRGSQSGRRSWCCSFTVPPSSPENMDVSHSKPNRNKSETLSKPSTNSVPNSPQSIKSGLGLVGRMDPRRILSPGRVSPIDSDYPIVDSIQEISCGPSTPADSANRLRAESFRAPTEKFQGQPENPSGPCLGSRSGSNRVGNEKDLFDVRLNLRGKNGGKLVLELNSEVLRANSELFSGFILEQRKSSSSNGSLKMCRIEVPDVDNLEIFKESIELMFENETEISNWLLKTGVYRAIDILEVSASIMFTKGVLSCLKYLEAVPWTEEEEEKLRNLFTKFKFDDATTQDILSRLYVVDPVEDSQQDIVILRQLIRSITSCTEPNARIELKSLVKGLLCRSSVYNKEQLELMKKDLYSICQSCLSELVTLFQEATNDASISPLQKKSGKDCVRPLIERISRQVDNIIWLIEILLDRKMGEEFVCIWADQKELVRMHESTSPMVRYEISRVSAMLFIAMGMRRLQCRSELRSKVLWAWFGPMLSDFGWLQRCKKGLNMKALEGGLGQTLLTLPLSQQSVLFMEWFQVFSKNGTECPNLSSSFQIWWRRSYQRGSETHAIESR